MELDELIRHRSVGNPLRAWSTELLSAYRGNRVNPLLNDVTAEIGLLLINAHPRLRSAERDWELITVPEPFERRYRRLYELIPKSGGTDRGFHDLLIYFFGPEKARYVSLAWERQASGMYQQGLPRRSFRAPLNRTVHFPSQLRFIIRTLPQFLTANFDGGMQWKFYELSVAEQAKYDIYGSYWRDLSPVWAAAIDLGNEDLLKQIGDIIHNNDDTGQITRAIIKALLTSEKRECWEMVGNLLLTAGRQEGLRQTIIEALDETSIGALKYLIKLILDHKLTRFSSVVRGIDVWAGLGWESEREAAVRKLLEKANECLNGAAAISSAFESKNNTDIYIALWATAVADVDLTAPMLEELYSNGDSAKRILALKFAVETRHESLSVPLFVKALDDPDQAAVAMALHGINQSGFELVRNESHFPGVFDTVRRIAATAEKKPKLFDGKVFSWMRITFDRNLAFQAMIGLTGESEKRLHATLEYFDQMNRELREHLTKCVLGDCAGYLSKFRNTSGSRITPFQRKFAFRILSDKAEFVNGAAFRALEHTQCTDEEIERLEELLRRKGAAFRGNVIALIANQSAGKVVASAGRLLRSADYEQRLAGLDLAIQLQRSGVGGGQIKLWASEFASRTLISEKERILLDQLLESDDRKIDDSFENGFGLWDPAKAFSPVVSPKPDPKGLYESLCADHKWDSSRLFGKFLKLVGKEPATHRYGFSMPFDEVSNRLADLGAIFHDNKEYEYEVVTWNGSKETVLLANGVRQRRGLTKYTTPREDYEDFPLPEIWEHWYLESGLKPVDLFIISLAAEPLGCALLPGYKEIMPEGFKNPYSWSNPIVQIVDALTRIFPYADAQEFLIGACTRLFSMLTDAELKRDYSTPNSYSSDGYGWQNESELKFLFKRIISDNLNDDQIKKFWNLANWRQFSGREENFRRYYPPLPVFARAFESAIITEDEMYRGLMHPEHIRELTGRHYDKTTRERFRERYAFIDPMLERVREHCLDIELKRGDSQTPVSEIVGSFGRIVGARRFVEILAGLGKTTLTRGYSYSGGDLTKQSVFSQLLKYCHPAEDDTQAIFDDLVRSAKISEKRLIEAAVYAPQWHRFVSANLGWKGLDSAVWWMHAHTKMTGYNERNSEAESEIARFSDIPLDDFRNGAVDKGWFGRAFKEIGKDRWEIVYDAAKYISEGNGHRRARLYADVMIGKLKIKEITATIRTKRDQDYLRIYGLVPFSRPDPRNDLLDRYNFIEVFKKESRQFGAQKQASEAAAARIALENLARNAGYADPLRLSWAMETTQADSLLSPESEIHDGGISVTLKIDADGKAEIDARQDGKTLKSVSAKLKKDPRYVSLAAAKKLLREQLRRSRSSLEAAMTRGDSFEISEISALMSHPVIAKQLEKLVFVSDSGLGFYRERLLVSPAGESKRPEASDIVRIAHPVDLFQSGDWSDYQRYCFDHGIKQPFKQIYRELYLPTGDELKEVSVSRRYAGHQVNPKQTLALLRTRGWTVDHEAGLQRVFHREGFAATMYALADWFSPADVESPTLETVQFENLKDGKNRPFAEVDPIIFSEVMRDIDLVVSVAHVGGIDAEASQSSIEMRAALLREIIRMFKLENVELTDRHAMIRGTRGEYSVHLGSAVVHKLPGMYVSIIPVHSQHRGRLFLPFADDDPKSAELISKVLMLSRDREIRDPTILGQLV